MFDWIITDKVFYQQNSLWIMFASAFCSATILPGNSEVVFLFLITHFHEPIFSTKILSLLLVATMGNTLGGMTTYAIGRWFPTWNPKKIQHKWALHRTQNHGIWVLLFSWLPIVGDIFCALAGWLHFSWLKSFLVMMIGKLLRYVFLFYIGQI